MSNFELILNHLEFLGYRVDKKDANPDDSTQIAFAYSDSFNLIVINLKGEGVLLQNLLLLKRKDVTPEMDRIVNLINNNSDIMRVSIASNEGNEDRAAELVSDFCFLGDYSKNSFSFAYQLFLNDRKRLFTNEEYLTILKEQ